MSSASARWKNGKLASKGNDELIAKAPTDEARSGDREWYRSSAEHLLFFTDRDQPQPDLAVGGGEWCQKLSESAEQFIKRVKANLDHGPPNVTWFFERPTDIARGPDYRPG